MQYRVTLLSLCPQIVEMAPADSVIGQLVVTDPDNEGVDGVVQNFTLTIVSDHKDRFYIDGDNQLKVSSFLK